MNDTEPSASDVAAFENDLKNHQVKLLIYNSQATDPVAERLLKLARQPKVPVVGVTETSRRARATRPGWRASSTRSTRRCPQPRQ